MDKTLTNEQSVDQFLEENPNLLDNLSGDELFAAPADLSLSTGYGDFNGFSAPQEVVPLQPAPVMLPQMVPLYHPTIGWFYPATAPVGIAPPTYAPPPPMFPTAGMTPITSVPTSGTSTPTPAVTNTTSPTPAAKRDHLQSKPKYGPGAFCDARARGRTSVGAEEANYFTSTASRREGRGRISTDSLDKAFSRAETRPSIVQACICNGGHEKRVKRPRNAFIMFRVANGDEVKKKLGTSRNDEISRAIGALWKKQPQEVKDHYHALAQAEKKRHEIAHPDYKYKPGGPTRQKFGTEGCTCGAWELNNARYQEKKRRQGKGKSKGKGKQNVGFQVEADTDTDDNNDAPYIPPRNQPPAPTAVMLAPPLPHPDLDIASLGLPANQQVEAQALYAGLKRKHNLTVSTGRETTTTTTTSSSAEKDPPRKRRSSRRSSRPVNYTEPSSDIFDDFDFHAFSDTTDVNDLFDFDAAFHTPRRNISSPSLPGPSPKTIVNTTSPSRKASRTTSSPRLPVTASSPPAANTRARKQSTPEAVYLRGVIEIEGDSDDGDGETMVVAKKRAGSQNSRVSGSSARGQMARRRSVRGGAVAGRRRTAR